MYTMASRYELDWKNTKFPYPTETAQMAYNDYIACIARLPFSIWDLYKF